MGKIIPAAWISAGAGLLSAVNSVGGSSGGGSSGSIFTGQNTAAADAGWLSNFNNASNTASQTGAAAAPLYQQSLANAQGINYNPYQAAANTAGQQYGALAGTAGQQAGQYGQAAQTALGQQQSLYSAGNTIMNQAADPNNAQMMKSQQQLTDQVNAGQAARGLGNSPVGGQEYNNAMSNFDIGWNTQKLNNEAIGASALQGLSNAGGAQGQLYGADLSGQLNAGGQQAGFTQQSAGIPLSAQQYVGQQPGVAASAYTGQMSGLENMYGQVAGAALPYLSGGQGAQQFNTNNANAQNSAAANALMQGLSPNAGNSANNPNSWLTGLFSGSNGGQASGGSSLSGGDQSSIWASNGYGGGV